MKCCTTRRREIEPRPTLDGCSWAAVGLCRAVGEHRNPWVGGGVHRPTRGGQRLSTPRGRTGSRRRQALRRYHRDQPTPHCRLQFPTGSHCPDDGAVGPAGLSDWGRAVAGRVDSPVTEGIAADLSRRASWAARADAPPCLRSLHPSRRNVRRARAPHACPRPALPLPGRCAGHGWVYSGRRMGGLPPCFWPMRSRSSC